MSIPSRYLGIDVSKDTLQVAFERNHWQFPNSKEGHRKLVAQIKKQSSPIHVVCEATGPYHLAMCLSLQEAGIAFTISNPARIHYFGRSEGIIAKNDPIDAELIERFANAKRPEPDPPLCPHHLVLCEMVAYRRQLVDMIAVFRIQQKQVHDPALIGEIKKSITLFTQRVRLIEQHLRKKIETLPHWKKKYDQLVSVKGVGFVTAVVLLVKMPELGSLNRGQCAALSGLAPYDDDSGKHKGKRSIKGGRCEVRRALYMAAVTAVQCNPILKTFHQHLLAEKKPFKVAITAVMRKLLIHLNGLLKTDQPPAPAAST